jgi:hypothetical protein
MYLSTLQEPQIGRTFERSEALSGIAEHFSTALSVASDSSLSQHSFTYLEKGGALTALINEESYIYK